MLRSGMAAGGIAALGARMSSIAGLFMNRAQRAARRDTEVHMTFLSKIGLAAAMVAGSVTAASAFTACQVTIAAARPIWDRNVM